MVFAQCHHRSLDTLLRKQFGRRPKRRMPCRFFLRGPGSVPGTQRVPGVGTGDCQNPGNCPPWGRAHCGTASPPEATLRSAGKDTANLERRRHTPDLLVREYDSFLYIVGLPQTRPASISTCLRQKEKKKIISSLKAMPFTVTSFLIFFLGGEGC